MSSKESITQQNVNYTRKHNYFTIPASLIASILLAINPKAVVSAETETATNNIDEIESLYNEFRTLLNNEELEEVTEGGENEPTPELVEEDSEIRLIKDNLLLAIEKAGSGDLATQLKSSDLTVEQLDLIFEEIVTALVSSDVENEGNTAALILPEEVDLETEEEAQVAEEEVAEEPTSPLEDDEDEEQDQPDSKEETPNENTEAVDEVSEEEEKNVQEVVDETKIATPSETPEKDKGVQLQAATLSVKPMKASVATVQTTASQTEQETIVYTVKTGDTLNSIAEKYGTTADRLAEMNNLKNKNIIYIGQRLVVSGDASSVVTEDLSKINQKLTNEEFINIMGDHAKVIAKEHNLYASVMVAQAALESGFGSSALSSAPNYNLFGIKGSYNGESVNMRTSEYFSEWERINANFKKYPSYRESLLDNANLLRNGTSWDPYYYSGTWLENAASYQEATSWLEGRYATDPSYASKLNNLIARYDLTRFDMLGNVVVTPPESKPESEQKPETKPVTPSSGSTYTVKAGDTLSHISRAYKMSVSELKQLNNLKSDLIYVGQTLKVKGSTPAPKPADKPQLKPVTPPSNSTATYTVKVGDTLSHISVRYGMSVSELKQINNLKSDIIYVGQTLKVKSSAPTSKPADKPESKPVETPSNNGTYTVKAGDTLSHISRAYKMSVSELKQLNKLKSDIIYVGQTLKVKGSTPAPKPADKPQSKPVTPPSNSTATYTVKVGDTLSHISVRYGMSVSELKQINNLKSDIIYVGQTLKIKSTTSTSKPADKSQSKPVNTPSNNGTYTVKAGDTLSHISRAYNMSVSVSELKQLNNLKSDLIYVGQTLKVKGSTPAPKPVTPSSSSTATYTVKAGDTLSHISRAYNMSVSELKQLNNLKSDIIYVGQTLKVKGSTSVPKPADKPQAKPVSTSSNNGTYTVKAGDTLSHISRAYKMSVSELKQLNNLKSDLIYVGQSLKVKADSKTVAPSSSVSNSSNSQTYRVVRGDTLSGIAVKYNTNVQSLKSKNNLKSDLIFVGQLLKL